MLKKNQFLSIISIVSSIIVGADVNSFSLNTYYKKYFLNANDKGNKYSLLEPEFIENNSAYDSSEKKLNFTNRTDKINLKNNSSNSTKINSNSNSIISSGYSSSIVENRVDNSTSNSLGNGSNQKKVVNKFSQTVKSDSSKKDQKIKVNSLGSDFNWNNHMRGASGSKLIPEKSWLDLLFRSKHIDRWHILNSYEPEKLSNHLLDTAYVAHSLALIRNKLFNGKLNPDRVFTLAAYHDVPEIYTGDMPTTTKYRIPEMKDVYSKVESIAKSEFLKLVPDELKNDFFNVLNHTADDEEEWVVVKEADIIVAYIKSIIEYSRGNYDYEGPLSLLESQLDQYVSRYPEMEYFLYEILPSFESKSN